MGGAAGLSPEGLPEGGVPVGVAGGLAPGACDAGAPCGTDAAMGGAGGGSAVGVGGAGGEAGGAGFQADIALNLRAKRGWLDLHPARFHGIRTVLPDQRLAVLDRGGLEDDE